MIEMIFPFALQIFKWFVSKKEMDQETKKRFFEFVEMTKKNASVTLGARTEFNDQVDKLKSDLSDKK